MSERRMAARFLELLRFKPKPRKIGPIEWATMHGWPQRNPVHEALWPDCREPLPHGHRLFDISRDPGDLL